MKPRIPFAQFTDHIDHPGSAHILAINTDDEALLLSQQSEDLPFPTLTLPSDHLQPSETPEQAARRALAEQASHKFGLARHLTTISLNRGYTNEWASIFTARVQPMSARGSSELRWLSANKAREALRAGYIYDAPTQLAIGQWLSDPHWQLPDLLDAQLICTGNFYRSRLAEIYLRHASGGKLAVDSRGLGAYRKLNKGMISPHTHQFLVELGVPGGPQRFPEQLETIHLQTARHIVVLDEQEHRPMMEAQFPDWADRVSYWQIRDTQFTAPEDALPALKEQLNRFLAQLNT